MNENRNSVIAKGEDNALNEHLDNRDNHYPDNPCEVCEEEEAITELGNKELCQSCYENAIEQADR